MMGLNLRKLVVGLAALSVLAGVFALYLRLDRTPPIVVDAGNAMAVSRTEVNDSNAHESVGTFSGVGIGTVRHTDFLHRDPLTNRIDRRIGFEELLHEQGDRWEITKPYMWMYLERVTCRVTADRGWVQFVDTFGRPMPTDAEFRGNVIIHVAPTNPDDPWECFIHLDDVGFLAEKSLFSSQGAVRFLSRAMRLTGTGMELLYDGPRSRLELFRIFDLDSLRLRSSEIKTLAKKKGDDAAPQDASAKTQESHATVADSNTPPDVYQCVFRRNVRLDEPNIVAVARDVLSINNIQWARPAASDAKDKPTADPNAPKPAAAPIRNALNTAASSYPAMNSIPDELYDIVVTCDGGADITLLGAPGLVNASKIRAPESPSSPASEEIVSTSDRQQIVAQRVDFDFLSNDTTMAGPVAMRFLVDANSLGGSPTDKPMPVDVAAKGAVRYLAKLKQIVLEGGSTATLRRIEPDFTDEHRLTAPRLTLDLADDSNSSDEVKVRLRKFVADAGSDAPAVDPCALAPVAVRMWHRGTGGELLGMGALDAHELQYQADLGQLAAIGPGLIWLQNAATIQSKDDPNTSLKPCWVRMTNFDSLTYWEQSKRVVAEDDSQQLVLDYFPLIDSGYGPQTRVVAGHVEATLQEIAGKQMGLVSLVASQGIDYNSEIDNLHFSGSEMVYDQVKSLMTIQGDELRPCYLNGMLVDTILVDPKTRKIQTETAGPSIFQIRR
jgi:hypothetical protein